MAVIKHEAKGDVRVIAIDVRFVDEAAIEQCKREIMELLDKTEESNVLLHFGRVTFMSSAALGMLIRVNKKCKEYNIIAEAVQHFSRHPAGVQDHQHGQDLRHPRRRRRGDGGVQEERPVAVPQERPDELRSDVMTGP